MHPHAASVGDGCCTTLELNKKHLYIRALPLQSHLDSGGMTSRKKASIDGGRPRKLTSMSVAETEAPGSSRHLRYCTPTACRVLAPSDCYGTNSTCHRGRSTGKMDFSGGS
eukprot:m.864966 g.864966  ORF g.864966 m.864966 type:complete len:111 (-) comp23547_c0_seq33:2806-3138(-)